MASAVDYQARLACIRWSLMVRRPSKRYRWRVLKQSALYSARPVRLCQQSENVFIRVATYIRTGASIRDVGFSPRTPNLQIKCLFMWPTDENLVMAVSWHSGNMATSPPDPVTGQIVYMKSVDAIVQ